MSKLDVCMTMKLFLIGLGHGVVYLSVYGSSISSKTSGQIKSNQLKSCSQSNDNWQAATVQYMAISSISQKYVSRILESKLISWVLYIPRTFHWMSAISYFWTPTAQVKFNLMMATVMHYYFQFVQVRYPCICRQPTINTSVHHPPQQVSNKILSTILCGPQR